MQDEELKKPSWYNIELIAKFNAKYGDVFLAQHPKRPEIALLCRRPLKQAYFQMLSAVNNKAKGVKRGFAIEKFVRDAVVFPTDALELDKIFNENPAFIEVACERLVKAAGYHQGVTVKKVAP
jgi:hypothetical protein